MHRILSTFGVLLLWGVVAQGQSTNIQEQVLVQLRPGASLEALATALQAQRMGHRYVRPLAPRWGCHLWRSTDPEALRRALDRLPHVQAHQTNALVAPRTAPSDVEYPRQWALDSLGAEAAWAHSTGGTNGRGDRIVCAVVDGTFDVDHEDVADNLWHNRGEIPNNGLDDDQNGYVDDYAGWQVVFDTDRHDYGPLSNHGTAVLGIIGARGNNGLGVAGINWATELMLVSAHTSAAITDLANVLEAYYYIWEQRRRYEATDGQSGAYVVAVNASWGIDLAQAPNYPLWCALYDSLGRAGILSVAAATNRNVDIDRVGDMPCTCPSPYLIAVGESRPREEQVGGYGRTHVDLFAPGGSQSTRWGDRYGVFGGTSAAAPHVAGAVALLYSYAHPAWATLQREQPARAAELVKALLLRHVVPNESFEASVSGGRLHLGRAMQGLVGYFEAAEQDDLVALYPVPAGDVLTVVTEAAQGGDHAVAVYNAAGQRVAEQSYAQAGPGRRHWRLEVADLPAGVYHLYWQRGVRRAVRSFVKMP